MVKNICEHEKLYPLRIRNTIANEYSDIEIFANENIFAIEGLSISMNDADNIYNVDHV